MFNTNNNGTSSSLETPSSTSSTSSTAGRFADQTAMTVDHAIKSTQRATNDALNGLADSVESLRRETAPLLNRVSEQASSMARRGVDGVRESSQQLREKAGRAGDNTVAYIKDEPFKSILIAAATGAALMAAISLLSGSRRRD